MHPKEHISILPGLLKVKGAQNVIISPGSRNAPLIKLFFDNFGESCLSIVDERSAAFFGLGMAIKTGLPSILLSTSGSAVLNYAPAIAEAYYQGIPLIVVTADRPPEWVGQNDNQTILQKNIFANYIKYSCQLPLDCTCNDDLWYTNRMVNEAYNISVSGCPGPVHINVPLREPLYGQLTVSKYLRNIELSETGTFSLGNEVYEKWYSSQRILVVCGQMLPDIELSGILNQLAGSGMAVVIAEALANIGGRHIANNPELLLAMAGDKVKDNLPSLVIYFGGQVVSKRLKAYLRQIEGVPFWHINPSGAHIDTFKKLSKVIPLSPKDFFREIIKNMPTGSSTGFCEYWLTLDKQATDRVNSLLPESGFSDLWAFFMLSRLISKNELVFAGNSSVIRYLQLFGFSGKALFSNRGTSGIDGCLSTACGIARTSAENVIAILGDLSFVYDSNGLWNKNLPKNLKVVVINNSGGGIFSLLEGPEPSDVFERFQVAHHPVNLSILSAAFGVKYLACNNAETFEGSFHQLMATNTAALLEIKTPSGQNPEIFRTFIENISKQ
ncbi:MAG: 2-succinyl-5-enolpyruvyl-6-hydroxy-3-cyclohexene-1-carboxylic-acid synthase [Bacteroidales bacterium]|nr:2-succinyl-5-enolpyruvyl-6-hydroxy-3-cyclohexene-1-carboxylic-acid synthase [Bacteroidales bacterium]